MDSFEKKKSISGIGQIKNYEYSFQMMFTKVKPKKKSKIKVFQS
jgi:hypothetical protein